MAGRILLVNVCYDFPVVTEGVFTGINKVWPPISLAYSCAILKKMGAEAKVLDANALRIPPNQTGTKSTGFNMVFVSSSSYDRWECPHLNLKPTIDTCKSIRASNPQALIFLVGSHGSVRKKEMLDLTGADAVVVGEPENTVAELASLAEWKTAKGIAYISEGNLTENQSQNPVDLDTLPLPDLSDLPLDKYFFEMLGRRFAVVEASRGCPFNCSYCLKVMFGAYRKKSTGKVKAEIMQLISAGVKNIFFLDLEFTVNRKLVEELCDWLISEGNPIRWSCQTRLDSVDEKLLTKMRKAGCKLVMYGVESASSRILELIGKNINVEKIRAGMAATKKAGISSACFFMFGFPSETDDEREKTVDLALELNPDYASFFLCRPYPGTRCYEGVKDESPGVFPLGVGSDDELVRLKMFCDRAFGRFYYRPSFILKRVLSGDITLLFNQLWIFLYKRGWIRG